MAADFSSRAEAIRRLSEVELDAILLREVCHSRQNWQRDGDWHDWIEISPDERERLVAAAKLTARLTAQVETLTKDRDQLDWAARKFQARIGELMQQVETLQGERDALRCGMATYDELCQWSIRTGAETALNVAADVELKRRGYHFLPEVGMWVLTLEAPMTPRLTDAERVELTGLLASITLPTLTAREREVAQVVALKMKQQAEAQVTALQGERDALNELLYVASEANRLHGLAHADEPLEQVETLQGELRAEPPRDLMDDLHAVFTEHGILSRQRTELVGDVISWAARGCRQSQDKRLTAADAQVTALRALLEACDQAFDDFDDPSPLRQQIRAALGDGPKEGM